MTFLHDAELGDLTKGVIVPEGGVKPNILKVSRSGWFGGCNSEGCSCLLFVLRPKRSEAKFDLASCSRKILAVPRTLSGAASSPPPAGRLKMTLNNRTRPAAHPAPMSQTIDVFPPVFVGVDSSSLWKFSFCIKSLGVVLHIFFPV